MWVGEEDGVGARVEPPPVNVLFHLSTYLSNNITTMAARTSDLRVGATARLIGCPGGSSGYMYARRIPGPGHRWPARIPEVSSVIGHGHGHLFEAACLWRPGAHNSTPKALGRQVVGR